MKYATLSEYCQYGTIIRPLTTDTPARVLSVSRNLRGLLDYSRRVGVACVITRRSDGNRTNGALTVVYKNGAIGRAHFASHSILIDWVRNRRSWRYAEFRHLDGELGYLSRPGIIGGQ